MVVVVFALRSGIFERGGGGGGGRVRLWLGLGGRNGGGGGGGVDALSWKLCEDLRGREV